MTLRNKILLSTLLPVFVLFTFIYLLSSNILFKGFGKIEEKWAQDNLTRLSKAFEGVLKNLEVKSSDWAIWDDTYNFITDHNATYKESNLGDVTFDNLRITHMLYLNNQGEVVHKKAFDYIVQHEIPFSEDLLKNFQPGSQLIQHDTLDSVRTGAILLPDSVVIVVARGILTSQHTGPVNGTLVFGQYLDERRIQELSETIKMPLKVFRLDDKSLDANVLNDIEQVRKNSQYIHVVDQKSLWVYILVNDIYNKPALVIRAQLDRDIFNQALRTNQYILFSLISAFLLFVLLMTLILRQILFNKVFKLVDNVHKIGQSNDFNARIQIEGKDEIGLVSRTINDFLDKLANTKEEFRKSEERFRTLSDSVPVLIWMSDEHKNFVYFNKRWLNFTGRSFEEEAGLGWTENIHKDDKKRYLDYFDNVFELEKGFSIDYRLKRFDGVYRWMSDTAVPRMDEKGKFLGYIGSSIDISERKVFEEKITNIANKEKQLAADQERQLKELQAAHSMILQRSKELEEIQKANLNILEDFQETKKQAEEASRTKSHFLANMSHEIRTPLNAILGFSDLLQKSQLNAEQKKYLDVVSSSGELLLSIISDILDISKVEAGKIKLENIDFRLDYLVENTMNMIRGRLGGKNIQLTARVHEGIHHNLIGDPTRLRQVLINLLGNAVKFTSAGEVGISVNVDSQLPEEPDYVMLKFIVHDTGIGIPLDKQTLIFEPFTQADSSTTRQFGGTGLGLTITKQLVELMGGKIWLESKEGQGTKFYFTVKLKKGQAPNVQDIQILPLEKLKGKKVYIVDETKSSRELLHTICQELGMAVPLATHSIKDIIKVLEQKISLKEPMPDLILSDLLKSDAEVQDLAAILHGNKNYAGIKFIAISSEAKPGIANFAQKQGFSGYLPKPFTRQELSQVIRTVLGDRRQQKNGQIVTKHLAQEISLKGIKILVVEDNVPNQQLLRAYFKIIGCDAEFANNGQEAIEMLSRNEKFDVCLMDMQMPVLGGIEATKFIRKNINKELPIIALTAGALKEDQENCLNAGMNDFLTKPINMAILKEKIALYSRRS